MSDAETLTLLREIAASEVGLPPTLASRVSGSTIGEMRADAKALAREAGYTAPQPRGDDGRFAKPAGGMSQLIREAAGYPTADDSTADDAPPERPAVADLGIGRGGAALPRQSRTPGMSALIRGTVNARKTTAYLLAEQDQAGG